MVYGEKDREYKSARTYPKMVLIHVAIHDEGHLAIDAPNMKTLYVKIPSKFEKNESFIK